MQNRAVILRLEYAPNYIAFGIIGLPPDAASAINLFIGNIAVVSSGRAIPEMVVYPFLIRVRFGSHQWTEHVQERVQAI